MKAQLLAGVLRKMAERVMAGTVPLASIGEDENRSDRVDVLLVLSCNTFLVELVLPNTAGVSQPSVPRIRTSEEVTHTHYVQQRRNVPLCCCCS